MTFADFIEIEMASILQDWEAFAATRLPAARGLSVAALRNDAENLLRCIADDMRSEQSELHRNDKGRGLRPDNAPGVTRFARCHAQLRLAQGFTLDQLVSEFRAVRASVVRRWVATAATGTSGALDALVRFGEAMDQSLTEIATLGLPIHITELDVNSAQGGQRGTGADVGANASTTQGGLVEEAERKLAETYAGIFRAFVKHRDSVKMVTFWGVNDANSWRAQGKPLLFDGENRPKAAFHSVIETSRRVTVDRE